MQEASAAALKGLKRDYSSYVLKEYTAPDYPSGTFLYAENNFLILYHINPWSVSILNYDTGDITLLQNTNGAGQIYVKKYCSINAKYIIATDLNVVWVFKDGVLLQTISEEAQFIGNLAISPNGKYIVFDDGDTIRIYQGT